MSIFYEDAHRKCNTIKRQMNGFVDQITRLMNIDRAALMAALAQWTQQKLQGHRRKKLPTDPHVPGAVSFSDVSF